MEALVSPVAPRGLKRSFFDFVVANRPIYIPGSGPPVPEPTLMPVHDKDGVILRKIPLGAGHANYIVTYEDKPYLKICVDEINVLDYVSARTYENFNREEYHEILKKENEDPRTKAKNERMRHEEDGKKPARGKPRKKRKKNFGSRTKAPAAKVGTMGPLDLPSRRRISETEEEPKSTFKSPQRPSHSSPTSRQMGLAQTIHDSGSDDDGEEEEINQTQDIQVELNQQFENNFFYENLAFNDTLSTEAALDLQLQGLGVNTRPAKPKAGPSRLSQQHNAISISSDSSSVSPEPTPNPLKIPEPAPILPPGRTKREASSRRSTSSSSQSNTNAHYRSKRQRRSEFASASISSIEAGRTYEKLTQNGTFTSPSSQKTKVESIHSRHTSSKSQTRPKSMFSTKPPPVSSPAILTQESTSSTSSDDDEIDEDEYTVDCILADKWTKDKNRNPIQSFLIKWEGYPESQATWETEDNLPEELISDYKATKSQFQNPFTWQSIVDIDPGPEEDEKGRGKGKGRKKAIPGDTSDEESLFLPGSGPRRRKSPYFVEDIQPNSRETGRGKKRVSFSADEDEVMD